MQKTKIELFVSQNIVSGPVDGEDMVAILPHGSVVTGFLFDEKAVVLASGEKIPLKPRKVEDVA